MKRRQLKDGWTLETVTDYDKSWPFLSLTNFEVVEITKTGNETIYSVEVKDEVMDWLAETFVEFTDYIVHRSLKGVWVDMPEKVYILLKLRWA